MQLMPDTADDIGVHNAFDPRANIFGGSRLLRRYLDEFRSLKKTLVAYNAGPTWVRKRKGIPKETKIYIRRVINYYHIYKERGRDNLPNYASQLPATNVTMSRFKHGDTTMTRESGLFRQSRLKPLLLYFFSEP